MIFYILKDDKGLNLMYRNEGYLRTIFKFDSIRGYLTSLHNSSAQGYYTNRGIKLTIKRSFI